MSVTGMTREETEQHIDEAARRQRFFLDNTLKEIMKMRT